MLVRLPLLKLVRLWAVLLLATIGLQAVVPLAPSPHKAAGSAFSAATQEVALYVQRGERGHRQIVAPQPLATFLPSLRALPAPVALLAEAPPSRPDSTGPPLRESTSWKPAPRAPPHA